MRPRIYLAGPTVFHADADDAGARLVALCDKYGCEGLYPLDFALDGDMSAATIQAACLRELRTAAGVVADLSPFRGLTPTTAPPSSWALPTRSAYRSGRTRPIPAR